MCARCCRYHKQIAHTHTNTVIITNYHDVWRRHVVHVLYIVVHGSRIRPPLGRCGGRDPVAIRVVSHRVSRAAGYRCGHVAVARRHAGAVELLLLLLLLELLVLLVAERGRHFIELLGRGNGGRRLLLLLLRGRRYGGQLLLVVLVQ